MSRRSSEPAIRPEDELLPVPQLLGYGVQHILSMFGGVIAVPIIIGGAAGLSPADTGLLVSAALFVSGVATILQTVGVPFFGSQLPLVQGISFAAVSTMVTIVTKEGGGAEGLQVVFGSIIVASLVCLVIAPVFAKVVAFFPAVVTGSIVTVIGLSLLPVAGGWITGPTNESASGTAIALATVAFVLVLVMSKTPKLSRLAILLALVLGTAIAAVFGQTTWNGADRAIVAIPEPLHFGAPVFDVGAIISMLIVMIVIMVETTADILAVGEVVGTTVDNRRIADGLRADMVSSAVAPLVNSFPATAFAQNVGLVALTGIRSRFAVAVGGGVLALLGLSPWLAAVVGLLPLPVLAGAGIVLFGSVAASGIRTLSRVEYAGNNNMIIVASAIAFAIIPLAKPDFWGAFPDWWQTLFDSEISAAAVVAFTLNLFFNVLLPGTPEDPTDVAAAPATEVRPDEAEVLRRGGHFEAGQPVD